MDFTKMHGLGNDFVIVEAGSWVEADQYQVYASRVCNRNFGVGADGLIVIGPDPDADVFMRIFNSDGSEAMMCGNGIRCVGRYTYEHSWIARTTMSVRTRSGIKYPQILLVEGRVSQVRVDMGEPILDNAAIPVAARGSNLNIDVETPKGDFKVNAVSMGNPHCVVFVDSIEDTPVEAWGAVLETHELFPQRINVEFVQVISENEVAMRVWERGCGVTLACGTGACATAVAGVLQGKTGRRVIVHLLGGDLEIEWNQDDNHVYMTGPAEMAFTGQIDLT